MPKRKLVKQSALKDSVDDELPKRSVKLRKLDYQDVTISPSCVRLPISKPRKPDTKTRELQIARNTAPRAFDEIDQLVVRFSFLSLETRLPFKALGRSFPKFPLLPTEIRLIIWKLARPDSRIIKLARSEEPSKPYPFFNYSCHFKHDHLVSKIPVPNLLHTCYESRNVARSWYTVLFIPSCRCGGTYIDTERDYMYYGIEERKLLVDRRRHTPGWQRYYPEGMWTKDRRSIPNIVIHLNEAADGPQLVYKLLGTSRGCNELAKKVLVLGHRSSALKAGTMLSDLGKDPRSFETKIPATLKRVTKLAKDLEAFKMLEPSWEVFKPERIIAVTLFGTHNIWQTYGFMKKLILDRRVYLGFGPANAFERGEDCKDRGAHIKLK